MTMTTDSRPCRASACAMLALAWCLAGCDATLGNLLQSVDPPVAGLQVPAQDPLACSDALACDDPFQAGYTELPGTAFGIHRRQTRCDEAPCPLGYAIRPLPQSGDSGTPMLRDRVWSTTRNLRDLQATAHSSVAGRRGLARLLNDGGSVLAQVHGRAWVSPDGAILLVAADDVVLRPRLAAEREKDR